MTKKIKILTVDSGLGGLSITAELVERIKAEGQFEELEIIFFNCRPADEYGYAALESNELQAKIFSRALYAMYEKFQPDVILIACNTLSSIYKMCEFSKSPPVPVVGIIEDGVDKIFNLLLAHPEMQMIMFGTATTVSLAVHRNILIEKGIAPERLHYQNCSDLPNVIVLGPESDEVKNMVEGFMESGAAKTQGKSFGISLLCTHFAYSLPVFSEFAQKFDNFSGNIINPNSAMAETFLKKYKSGKTVNLSIKAYTHTTINPEMRQVMFPLLEKLSPDTAEALLNMVTSPDMFRI